MSSPIRTTIDKAGRVIIPKDIRLKAGLEPGMNLDIRYQDGRIEIEPATVPVKLVRKGRLLVLVPQGKMPQMPADVMQWARRQRDQELAGVPLQED
jgi:AbrB family looped-hinge helix DNA binding protein